MDETPERAGKSGGRDRGRLIAGIGVVVGVGLVLTLLIIGLANRGTSTDIADAVARGDRPQAPDLTLPVLTPSTGIGPAGQKVALKDLRGRPVLVNIWASWCLPCRDEAPVLQDLWTSLRRSGSKALVLGVDVQDVSDDARSFVSKYKLTYPSLRDGNGSDTKAGFETTGVPETYLIDPQGKIAWRHIGPVTADAAAQVRQLMESL